MIKRNFHTHTARCGHAIGSDEEYVTCAIRAGLQVLGFSDHAAYHTPMPEERMAIEEVDGYISSIQSLKEKYQSKIQLHVGMEVEYYESQWNTLAMYRKTLDYLILGQHNLELDCYSSYNFSTGKQLTAYGDCIEKACQRNLCDIIAHPDVCLWSYPRIDENVISLANRLADISVKYQIPLELNCGSGVRDYGYHHYQDYDRYAYPVREVFSVFAQKKAPVIIGLDIHNPDDFLTDRWLQRALSIVEGLDLNYVSDDYDLIGEATKRKKHFLLENDL